MPGRERDEQWTGGCRFGWRCAQERVALPGRGKRGGARTLVATRRASRWFFVFGFEKNEKTNVSRTELEALQWLAKQLLDLSAAQMEVAAQDGSIQEICHEH